MPLPGCLCTVLQTREVPLALVVGTELRAVLKSCEEFFLPQERNPGGQV